MTSPPPPERRKPEGPSSPLRTWTAVAVLSLLGAALRTRALGAHALWIDEAFSLWLARHGPGELIGWVGRIDQHPPLYYLLLHVWTAGGDGEAWLRGLSVAAGAATIPVFFAFARLLSGSRTALAATAILTLSPLHVRVAQEARMYGVLTLAAALALWGLARVLTRGDDAEGTRARRGWALYVGGAAAAAWTHNVAVLLPVAATAAVLPWILGGERSARRTAPAGGDPRPGSATPKVGGGASALRAPSLRSWALAHLALLLLWLPWAPTFVRQGRAVAADFWIAAPGLNTTLHAMTAFLDDSLGSVGGWSWALRALYAGVLIGGVRALAARNRRPSVLVALWLAPFALVLAAGWLLQPVLHARSLAWGSLPALVLLAAGLTPRSGAHRRRVALAAVLVIESAALVGYFDRPEAESWDAAAALVAARHRAGDLVVLHASWSQIPFAYYLDRAGARADLRGMPVDLFDAGALEPKMAPGDTARLDSLVAGRPRVWLVYSHAFYTDPEGLLPAALADRMRRSEEVSFPGVSVTLYTRR